MKKLLGKKAIDSNNNYLNFEYTKSDISGAFYLFKNFDWFYKDKQEKDIQIGKHKEKKIKNFIKNNPVFKDMYFDFFDFYYKNGEEPKIEDYI